ncbi:mechanosensitive ion channel family protein [Xanthovirga aplysinae]|uniref:mechanosensitive ion channel family protein n=1 Tax=Xanthovirga aplysinae TaxID=2529853 RepID=UPI0012BD1F72|nr:mechanosensitive ion channel family protein [Xanthovirga aplysinae]MTI33241.1 mechanosensitive ion channel family protein [Xanthovirga aplysinae]
MEEESFFEKVQKAIIFRRIFERHIIGREEMEHFQIKIVLTVGIIFLLFLERFLTKRFLLHYSSRKKLFISRALHTQKILNISWFILFSILLAIIWEVQFKSLAIYFASFFTVAGVALFASWSILSNITASLILFFYHPLRIGSRIKIVDGDNTITGRVKDITIFSILIITEDHFMVTYPNNLALQKPIFVMKNAEFPTEKKPSEVLKGEKV